MENSGSWEQLSDEKQVEYAQGLINTSRLQIDKALECVVVEDDSHVLVEGYWQSTNGYVIIEK